MELAPRYGALDGLAKADRLRLLPARDRPRRGDARGRGEEHELRDAPGPRRPAARVEVERQGRGGGGPRPRTSASLRRRRGPAMQECRDGKTLLRWERVRGRPRRPSESRGAAGSRPARARGAVRGPQMAERSDDMSQPRHPEASRGARPDVSCGMHQQSTRRRRARRASLAQAWIHLSCRKREHGGRASAAPATRSAATSPSPRRSARRSSRSVTRSTRAARAERLATTTRGAAEDALDELAAAASGDARRSARAAARVAVPRRGQFRRRWRRAAGFRVVSSDDADGLFVEWIAGSRPRAGAPRRVPSPRAARRALSMARCSRATRASSSSGSPTRSRPAPRRSGAARPSSRRRRQSSASSSSRALSTTAPRRRRAGTAPRTTPGPLRGRHPPRSPRRPSAAVDGLELLLDDGTGVFQALAATIPQAMPAILARAMPGERLDLATDGVARALRRASTPSRASSPSRPSTRAPCSATTSPALRP